IGDNRPDWVAGEIAAHAIGAMSLGMYRDALDEEVAYLLTAGGARIVFAEDEEQVEKLLGLGARTPDLRHIVYSDPRGIRKYSDPRLILADDLDQTRVGKLDRKSTRLNSSHLGISYAVFCLKKKKKKKINKIINK